MRRPPVILAYHGIADVDPRHDPVRLFVRPRDLRRQIERMRSRGYRFLAMADFAAALAAGDDLGATCALTFDDGTEDHLTTLAPMLAELGVPGTVYVCPGLFGDPYPWCDPAAGVRLMTTEEVVELSRHPLVEIGSHTIDHTVLGDASAEEAYREMVTCRERLEELLGEPVPSFCYPRCLFSEACPDAARRAGYTSAVTCGRRGSWDPFQLRREVVHTPDGRVTFELKARGVYQSARRTPPARLVRWATRGFRHRAERP
ncbi:MAG TPA: polysaccharide deacetylase family protein [Thermoleophilaceae bacterium]